MCNRLSCLKAESNAAFAHQDLSLQFIIFWKTILSPQMMRFVNLFLETSVVALDTVEF